MRTLFNAEMSELADDLIAMARHVEGAIDRANRAILTSDVALAETVIAEDAVLDKIEDQVDERCVLLIAQQQPVGLDLRTIVAALRISAALERMGDLAQHIAENVRRTYPVSAVPDSHRDIVEGMATAAHEAAGEIVKLLESRDLNVAAAIVSDDDVLDSLHAKAYSTITSDDYHGTAAETLDLALLARYYERFGDHAVGISRRIVYLVTGDHSGRDSKI